MLRKLLVTGLLVLCHLQSGCSNSGNQILIVLPNFYNGEFRIVKDSQKGQALVKENDWWVFEIPRDGTIYVREVSPFYKWHSLSVRYKNGESVDYEDLGTSLGTRSMGPNTTEGSTDFDGTTHRWQVIKNRKP
jgi:hypothetical protein